MNTTLLIKVDPTVTKCLYEETKSYLEVTTNEKDLVRCLGNSNHKYVLLYTSPKIGLVDLEFITSILEEDPVISNIKLYDGTELLGIMYKNYMNPFTSLVWQSSKSMTLSGVYDLLSSDRDKYGKSAILKFISFTDYRVEVPEQDNTDLIFRTTSNTSMIQSDRVEKYKPREVADVLIVTAGALSEDYRVQDSVNTRNINCIESFLLTNPRGIVVFLGSTSIHRGYKGKEAYVSQKIKELCMRDTYGGIYLVLPSVATNLNNHHGMNPRIITDSILRYPYNKI